MKKMLKDFKMMTWRLPAILLLGMAGLSGPAGAASDDEKLAASLVRVNVTTQDYDFRRPWQRAGVNSDRAIGAIIDGGRVLTGAQYLANATYLEFEDILTGEKAEAKIEAIDYEGNMALLKVVDPQFMEGRTALVLADTDAIEGDLVNVVQVLPNGDISLAECPITGIDTMNYGLGNRFLGYRLKGTLQYRFSHRSLPVMKEGELVGLVQRASTSAQTIDVAAVSIINHFLKDYEDGQVDGFPLSGIAMLPLRDPQLKEYIGLPEGEEGVFIRNIVGGRPAGEAGLEEGDVLLQIAGYDIDSRGNYRHPLHGLISLAHLIRAEHHVGDQVPMNVFRDGEFKEIVVEMDHRDPEEYLVPPYVVDRGPNYLIVGGLIMQELTRSYLRLWGEDWLTQGPLNLVYYDQNQDQLEDEERKKIVFISNVIPTQFTVGYELISNVVVTEINGQPILSLSDVKPALDKLVPGDFHKIEIEEEPYMLYLDPSTLPAIEQVLTQGYGLPELGNVN